MKQTIIDGPYVATIIVKDDIAHWWVSGKKNDETILMFRYSHGAKNTELNSYLTKQWGLIRSLCDYTQGMADLSNEINELDKETKDYIIQSHLKNNINNFDASEKQRMTVDMYKLLKSFNFKQPQKAIAQFESSLLGKDVKTTAINQRLAHAKLIGIL